MKFILITGPQAVGKMTVGQELSKITNLKLFHNHMTIELVLNFFDYGTPSFKRLSNLFREEIFKEVSNSDLEGLIFTYVWYFDDKHDWDYIENLIKIFKDKGSEIYFVELESNLEERIKRNKTEHRLNHKPSKRGEAGSDDELRDSLLKHRPNSLDGEIKEKNYIRINNTNISPEIVAKQIKDKFNL
ncbi:MAG TPA: AAA family ATPase [Candidatus Paceibacterota bacterium]|nr:AAA family ATPase [Candidatus Paceibacterota bacterium]